MKNKPFNYLLAFFIPFSIFYLCLNMFGISPTGDYDLLMIDSFQQYIVFYHELKRIVIEQDWQSLLYNWNLGVGIPFIGTLGYYLSSPFSILLLFFKEENLPYAYYLMTLLKISLASVTFYHYLRNETKSTNYSQLFFSCAYALMGYVVTYHSNVMWLDGVIFFPLLILSINTLVQKNKCQSFFWWLIPIFISNFYIAYMMGFAAFLYFIIQLMLCRSTMKTKFILIIKFFGSTLLAAGCCAILLVPVANVLLTSSQNTDFILSQTPTLISTFTKFFIGSYDGVDNNATANLYIGLMPLFFLTYAFVSRALTRKEKILYLLLISFLFISCFIQPIYLLWHGFKQPIWFPARFSFILSFFLLSLAYRGFNQFKHRPNRQATKMSFFINGLLLQLLFIPYLLNYENTHLMRETLSLQDLMANLLFIIIYSICILLFLKKRGVLWIGLLLTLSLIELDTNNTLTIHSLAHSQHYTSKELYLKYMARKDIYEALPIEDTHTTRIQAYRSDFVNETVYYQQSTLSTFNTLSYHRYNALLNRLLLLGETEDTQIVDYRAYSPLINHLFGVKYSGMPHYLLGNHYTEFSEQLQINPNVLSIGYLVSPKILEEIPWVDNFFENQELFLNQLIDEKVKLFNEIPYEITYNEQLSFDEDSNTYTYLSTATDQIPLQTEENSPEPLLFELNFKTLSSQPIYLSIPNYYNLFDLITYSFTGMEEAYNATSSLNSLYLNHFEPNQVISFQLKGTHELETFQFTTPLLYEFDEEAFETILDELHQNELKHVKVNGTTLTATLQAKKSGILLFTLPYDKGWSAQLNGKPTKILELPNGLMGIEVDANNYNIELTFNPVGLKEGGYLSLTSWGILFLTLVFQQKKNEKEYIFSKTN